MDCFDGKTILITGGTGSLGNELVDILLSSSRARKIIVYSRDELKQSLMRERFKDSRLRLFIGDVRDKDRLHRAVLGSGVQYIIHAAALKQVDAGETSSFEVVKTNVVGCQNVIDCAIDGGVERVVGISSDKASGPIANLYGATKLVSEKLLLNAYCYVGSGAARFAVIRYGNVIGSRGSVIPLFQRCVRERKPLPITDKRMTRFWLTLRQAANFVLECASSMEGNELFIPVIPSMGIMDLAETVDPGGERVFVGLRPGERLRETLMSEEESLYLSAVRLNHGGADHLGAFVIQRGEVTNHAPFEYRSDTNDSWLSVDEMREMIAGS